MAIVTQFAFDASAVTPGLSASPISASACPSMSPLRDQPSCNPDPVCPLLRRRALAEGIAEAGHGLTRLLTPYEPTTWSAGLAQYKARNPHSLISQVHVFPLGGIRTAADWMNRQVPAEPRAAMA